MLLNLSNHPSTRWPSEQLSEANRLFGQILDLSFPNIDPAADKEYVRELANEYLQKILTLQSQYNTSIAIHVMGELTFCFQFVSLMKERGIRCVASTTERITTDTPEGKLSKFVFVKFRDYY